MLLLSIDIETTGLDPDTCQILEIGAVCYDTESKSGHACFETLVNPGVIVGEPFALAMNKGLLERIAKGEGKPLDVAMRDFRNWLNWCRHRNAGEKFTPVGKNLSFDRSFLRKHPMFKELPLTHRSIDIGNLYWRPHIDRASLPDSLECKKRAGLQGEVAHTALADALEAAQMAAKYVADQMPVTASMPVPASVWQAVKPKPKPEPEPEREVFIEEAQSNWPGSVF